MSDFLCSGLEDTEYRYVDEIYVHEDFVCIKQELKNCWLLREGDHLLSSFNVYEFYSFIFYYF